MKNLTNVLSLISLLLFLGCAKLVDIGAPTDSLSRDHIYINESSARAALNGIYIQLASELNGFANASTSSVTILAGCSADEFLPTGVASAPTWTFYQHAVHPESSALLNMWADLYRFIFRSNDIMEGVARSTELSPDVKDQMIGEALFIRAFCNFYLVNLWGEVPIVTSTDYRYNNGIHRAPVSDVYGQIVADLQTSRALLPPGYSNANGERIRASRHAATALIGRVYLYLGEWEQAVMAASDLISENEAFALVPVSEVFLRNSREAIWQLVPPNFTTNEGNAFIPNNTGSLPPTVAINSAVIRIFDVHDQRLLHWVGQTETTGSIFHYPYKYKIRGSTQTHQEYSMVLRMAEQFLIRAEARLQLGDLMGARDDINTIRNRAGLEDLQENVDRVSLLAEIENERLRELFAEWGHRWLDLKRWSRVNEVLGAAKPGLWESYLQWYPIPRVDLERNSNLHQNDGYPDH